MEAPIVMEAPSLLVVIVQANTPDLNTYIHDDEYVVNAIAAFLNKHPEDIVVYCADNCIGPNLSAGDCDIRAYSRLTVEHINKNPIIISHYKCTPTPEEQEAEQRMRAQNAPLRRCNANSGNKHTSGLISLYFLGILYNIFVKQETSYHEPFKNSFIYSTEIENISSNHPLDTEGIQSDFGLITFLLGLKGGDKSIEEHGKKYVLTLVR